MKVFKRTHGQKPKTSALVLVITDAGSDDGLETMVSALAALRIRFSFKLALVFKAPELLFFNSRMLQFIADGFVDRVMVSDDPDFNMFDLTEFSKRQEVDSVFLGDVESLICNWPELIKLIVTLINADFELELSGNSHFIAITQNRLCQIDSVVLESFLDLKKHLKTVTTQSRQKGIEKDGRRCSLFVTKKGIERFGGIANFKNSKLLIGGLPPKSFKKIWAIDNDLTLNEFKSELSDATKNSNVIFIPGILSDTADAKLLLDINPAFTGFETIIGDATVKLSVPRGQLTIARTGNVVITMSDKSAIFVMSNYNKASYIAGALYGVAMQTYDRVVVHISDDISDDKSELIIKNFIKLIDKKLFAIEYKKNQKRTGTYWIRNSVINKFIDTDGIYFVNDSDDYSAVQRAAIQISILELTEKPADICFGDIVRVDKNFRLLPLDGKVERYGTASLASKAITHKKYGFYENIKKNADTEFIERIKHFGGKDAVRWFRYPILFQPFDGSNLTADIYKINENGQIKQSLGQRDKHKDLFKAKHMQLNIGELYVSYQHETFVYSPDYHLHLKDYLIE